MVVICKILQELVDTRRSFYKYLHKLESEAKNEGNFEEFSAIFDC